MCVFAVGPMLLGFYRVCRGWLFGIIDLFYYKLKKIRETTMSIYSNQGCIFSYDKLIFEVICLNLYVCIATNSSDKEKGVSHILELGCFFFNP